MESLSIFGANIFFSTYAQCDLFGKIIILLLVGMSLVCWSVLIHKIWLMHQVNKLSLAFHEALMKNKNSLLKCELSQLPSSSHNLVPHPYASIYHQLQQKTLEVLNKNQFFISQNNAAHSAIYLTNADLELLEANLSAVISIQNKTLEKNLFILSTIVTLAPFMGLLGTVWGILVTFSSYQTGSLIHSNSVMLGGISTALTTTVLGLIIAIPALISYNYLKNSIRHYALGMDKFLADLLSYIEIHYRKVE